jgi:hypothetical protein
MTVSSGEHRRFLDAFIAAAQKGDLAGLEGRFAEDVVSYSDGGGWCARRASPFLAASVWRHLLPPSLCISEVLSYGLISSFAGFPWGRMLVSSTRYQRIAVVLNQPQTGERRKAERMVGMESEIKIGQQFEFAVHEDKSCRQKAVVTGVLSNREEGLGPEADYYIADWIEARTLSEQPKALVFVLANDGNAYLNGEWVDIIVDLAA